MFTNCRHCSSCVLKILNAVLISLPLQAICPTRDKPLLSSQELAHKLESKLSVQDADLKTGLSSAFKQSLSDFMHKQIDLVSRSKSVNQWLGGDTSLGVSGGVAGRAAAAAAGLTAQQLEVRREPLCDCQPFRSV